MAHDGEMSGKPCAMCERKFEKQTLKKVKKIQRQYEAKLDKPFIEFSSEEIIEMFKKSVDNDI